jgi:hypothetical protein
LPGVDHAYFELVRVGMLLAGDDGGDGEGRERLCLILDPLHFEPDHGELVDDRVERGVGVEVLLEPGEGEFHAKYSASALSEKKKGCKSTTLVWAKRIETLDGGSCQIDQ